MSLEMRCIDDDALRLSALRGQLTKNAVEDAHPAPPDKPVVQGLVRTILFWRVPPSQPVLDHKHNAADNAAVVNARNAMRQGKVRPDALELRLGQPKKIGHSRASLPSLCTALS